MNRERFTGKPIDKGTADNNDLKKITEESRRLRRRALLDSLVTPSPTRPFINREGGERFGGGEGTEAKLATQATAAVQSPDPLSQSADSAKDPVRAARVVALREIAAQASAVAKERLEEGRIEAIAKQPTQNRAELMTRYSTALQRYQDFFRKNPDVKKSLEDRLMELNNTQDEIVPTRYIDLRNITSIIKPRNYLDGLLG